MRSDRTKKLATVLAFAAVMQGFSLSVWFDATKAPDRLWTTVEGWLYNGGAVGHLPTAIDEVTLNSKITTPDEPIVIPADCEAICTNLSIASISGNANNYVSDGRIPSLTLLGTLRAPSNSWGETSISVGHASGGFGLMRIGSGAVITNACLTVGNSGIGVVTNDGGALYFPVESGGRNLTVGANASGFGRYVQMSGSLYGKMHIGQNGTGVVEVAGGSVSGGTFFVGVNSEGRLELRGGTVDGGLVCGHGVKGHGVVEMSGGTLQSSTPEIGRGGFGEFRFRGGVVSANDLTLGSAKGGCGELYVDAEDGLTVHSSFLCGYFGQGIATQRSFMQQTYLKIGANTNSVSELTILAGATNKVGTSTSGSLSIGGYPMPRYVEGVQDGTIAYPGYGILTLQGGTLLFVPDVSTVNFFVGRYADGWGCLRGYGKIAPRSPAVTNVRMAGGNCVIRADGFGEERDLDLHEVVNITNYFGEVDVAGSTNGWYAVNKGRVLYPRTWFGTAADARCFGDYPYSAKPRFVNSVHFSITGAGNNNFFRGGLCAPDRSDIPSGLPPGDVIGVWNFGLFNHVNNNTKQSYSTVSLTFRYDHTKARPDRPLFLYRHNGTAWVRVGTAAPNDEHLISTASALSPLDSGTMNIGFFAVVVPKSGTMVLFR